MAMFVISTEADETVTKFVKETRDRLLSHNIVTNPFVGDVSRIDVAEDKRIRAYHIFSMRPIWPNVTYIGWVGLLIILYAWGLTYFAIPFLVFGLAGFFWSPLFFFYMLKLGLKKAGYKGEVKMVGVSKTLHYIIFERWSF